MFVCLAGLTAQHEGTPPVGLEHAKEQPHQGGLAGPVEPHQRVNLTGQQQQVDIYNRWFGSETGQSPTAASPSTTGSCGIVIWCSLCDTMLADQASRRTCAEPTSQSRSSLLLMCGRARRNFENRSRRAGKSGRRFGRLPGDAVLFAGLAQSPSHSVEWRAG